MTFSVGDFDQLQLKRLPTRWHPNNQCARTQCHDGFVLGTSFANIQDDLKPTNN